MVAVDKTSERAVAARRPATLSAAQLAEELGLSAWEVTRGQQLDVIPPRDRSRGWSRPLVEEFAGRVAEIRRTVADAEGLGAHRLAEQLAADTGLDVAAEDVRLLGERGRLRIVDHYKDWPLYSVADARGIGRDELAVLVAERTAWLEASLDRYDAARRLGWKLKEFERVAAECKLRPGRFDRYAIADLDALAADAELVGQVAADRLLGPDQAAAHVGIRRTDFDYAVAAGFLEHVRIATVPTGRYRTIEVPMYRTADVEALTEIPGVDWEEVRATAPGAPSLLREFAHRPPSRAAVVHAFVEKLAERYRIEVWARYDGSADAWEIDWARRDGAPTRRQVADDLAADAQAAQYDGEIQLGADWGEVSRWAKAMLAPGAAVILDTETTSLDGQIVEIAVIDACDGRVLLDTLVKATEPITPDAHAVHGISDADLDDAPGWDQVLPRVLDVTEGRTVLAYNADFDAGVIAADTARIGADAAHLNDATAWACLMASRSVWAGSWRWLPLGGGHRARGDCEAARDVLVAMSRGHGTTTPQDHQ